MGINKINSESNWGKAAADLNNNFDTLNADILKIKDATTKNKGYFATSENLFAALPSAKVGDVAFVGAEYPYAVYRWDGIGWANNGEVGGESVDLHEYPTKDELNAEISGLVVQETGYGEGVVMSQKATTEKLTELATKLIKIDGWGSSVGEAGLSEIGQVYFNSAFNELRKITTEGLSYIVIPFRVDAIYIYNNVLYIFDGDTLVAHDNPNELYRIEALEEALNSIFFTDEVSNYVPSSNYEPINITNGITYYIKFNVVEDLSNCQIAMATGKSGSYRIEPYIVDGPVKKGTYIKKFIGVENVKYISCHLNNIASYSQINNISIYQDNADINPELQSQVEKLESQVIRNTDKINEIGAAQEESGNIDTYLMVKEKRVNKLFLSANINTLSGAEYDNNWQVQDGVIKYLGGGGSVFTFGYDLPSGHQFLIEIVQSEGTLENAFYIQVGDTYKIDCYNGTNTMYCSCRGGGRIKIIPNSNSVFTLSLFNVRQIVSQDDAIDEKDVNVYNINCGNSDMSLVDGKWNVALGPVAYTMANNIGGSRSVAIGYNALKVWEHGMQNIGIGTFALSSLKYGNRNIAIGSDALYHSEYAEDNIVIGKGALGEDNESPGVLKSFNLVIGNHACIRMPDNVEKVLVVGHNSNYYAASDCIVLGNFSGTNKANRGITNFILIGNELEATKSNQVRIGNDKIEEVVIGNKRIIFNDDGTCSWEAVS